MITSAKGITVTEDTREARVALQNRFAIAAIKRLLDVAPQLAREGYVIVDARLDDGCRPVIEIEPPPTDSLFREISWAFFGERCGERRIRRRGQFRREDVRVTWQEER